MATAKEIAEVVELFVKAGLHGKLPDSPILIEHWGKIPVSTLKRAASLWIAASRFMPTIADLRPLIARCCEEALRADSDSSMCINPDTGKPHTDDELLELHWRVEFLQLVCQQPLCEGKCSGGGWVTNDDRELSVREFIRQGYTNITQQNWKRCPGGCEYGHVPPSEHEVAQLRARIFNQPQPTTRRKVNAK